jgi:prolyl-tRNA synthetase
MEGCYIMADTPLFHCIHSLPDMICLPMLEQKSKYPRPEDPRFEGSNEEKDAATAAIKSILSTHIPAADTMNTELPNRSYVVILNDNQWSLVMMRADRSLNDVAIKDVTKATSVQIASITEARTLLQSYSNGSSNSRPCTRIFIDDTLIVANGPLDSKTTTPVVHPLSVPSSSTISSIPLVQGSMFSLAQAGDACVTPSCNGTLAISRGIEVGHVFYLGDKYSKPLGATFLGSVNTKEKIVMEMGTLLYCFHH